MRKTYVERNGKWVEKEPMQVIEHLPFVIPDIEPYRSMATGEMITGGRRQHRNHLREHNCIELGNEDPRKHVPPKAQLPSPKAEIIRQLEDQRRGQKR